MKKITFLSLAILSLICIGCGEKEAPTVTEGSIKPVQEGAQQAGQTAVASDSSP